MFISTAIKYHVHRHVNRQNILELMTMTYEEVDLKTMPIKQNKKI